MRGRSPHAVLDVLVLVYVLYFVDRQILSIRDARLSQMIDGQIAGRWEVVLPNGAPLGLRG